MMNFSLQPDKKNILITGSCGFIGRHLAQALEKTYNVVCCDVSVDTQSNSFALDLTDQKAVAKAAAALKEGVAWEAVIHLASQFISGNESDSLSVFYNNLAMTKGIVAIAQATKPGKVVHFSSIAVYPNVDGTYSETSNVQPSVNTECLYGLSKFASENIIDCMLRPGAIDIMHLRVAQVYGEGMRSDRIIPMMRKELHEKNTITVFGNGERISNFIHINKLTEIVAAFLSRSVRGIFNVGDEHLSYQELAQRILAAEGDENSRIVFEERGSRAQFFLDTTKMNDALGIEVSQRP